MNMAKAGTVSPFKMLETLTTNPLKSPPLLGLRAIHYAHKWQ